VLITTALIEIPPRFAGQPPVNPESRRKIGYADGWRGATGLAEDVRYYGKWMRDEAEKRIGHLYPKVKLPPEQGGGEATVIAWLWARTVRCPNPACGAAAGPFLLAIDQAGQEDLGRADSRPWSEDRALRGALGNRGPCGRNDHLQAGSTLLSVRRGDPVRLHS
jgi:hypothetical protein